MELDTLLKKFASLLVRTICLIKYRRLGFLIHYIMYRDGSSKMVQLHNLHHAFYGKKIFDILTQAKL